MDVVAELQRLKDYREQLRQLAKPGLGRFERFRNAILEEAAIEEVISNPSVIDDCDENSKTLLFDYFIAIPLQEVLQCRGRFNNATPYEELDVMEQQLQVLVGEESLSQDDLTLLPDLFHEKLLIPEDAEAQEKKLFEDAKIGIKDIFKTVLFPGRKDALMSIFNSIAINGRDYASVCFINKQAGVYRSFEWEIIEGILRSPYFPDFFEECEREAGTPEIPYKYRNWPDREFFLNEEAWGMGVENYVAKLHPAILEDFQSDEGYENFKGFMDQLAQYGRITNDAYMEALLQLITGYRFEGAARRLRWSGEDERVRILFFVIKYISTVPKGRYVILQKGHNVDYVGLEEETDVYKNLVDQYNEKNDPSRFLDKAKGIGDHVLGSLHSFYSFFPTSRD